jgi:type I restriction enzyme S subunit
MNLTTNNSLAPWKDSLPTHWQAQRLGTVADIILSNVDKHTQEGELPVRLCNYTDVYKNDRITSALEFMQASALPREIERFAIRKNDVLATKDSEDPNDIAVPSLVAEDLPGVLCGYHLAIIRPDPRKIHGPFLAWVQASKQIRAQFEAQSVGVTRFALGHAAFKEALLPIPPMTEQWSIAAYLDDQTAKIDRLIALRRRQMELLKEQHVSLIQQVVTQGATSDIELKDSEVSWLGSIPQHWQVFRNRFLFREIDSRSSTGTEELLTVSHITGITSRSDKEDVTMFLAESNEGYKLCEVGDLAINTMWAFMGALGFSKISGIVSPSYNVYRLRKPAIPTYYDYLFRSPCFTKEILRHSKGIWDSRLRLYPDAFFEIRCPYPPPDEQQRIVEYIESAKNRADVLLSAYARQLETLAEYRAALIQECVTGQRRVPMNPM